MTLKQNHLSGPEAAQTLALQALVWIASDDDRLMAFLGMTGVDGNEIASRATDPVFLAGVLDWLLADESMLTAFAAETNVAPELALRMRAHLPGAAYY
jgi:hypothetical protein